MKVYWEVEDGYCGKSRTQTLTIDDEEYLDTPPDEREEFVEQCVQDNFDNSISWYIQHKEDVPEDDGRWDDVDD